MILERFLMMDVVITRHFRRLPIISLVPKEVNYSFPQVYTMWVSK